MAPKDILEANIWYSGGVLQNFYLQKDALRSFHSRVAGNPACVPIVVANEYAGTGQRRFLTGSPEDFVAAYLESDLGSRHAYELILCGRPCKLYYDVEFDRNVPLPNNAEAGDADAVQPNAPLLNGHCRGHEMTAKLIDYTLFMLNVFFNSTRFFSSGDRRHCLWTRDEVIELDSSTETKFSRHIIFPSVIFKSNKDCGEFVKFIMEPKLVKPYLRILMSEDMARLVKTRSELATRLAETTDDVHAFRAIRRRYNPPFWPEEFVFVQKLVSAAELAAAKNKNKENLPDGDQRNAQRIPDIKQVRFVDLTVYTNNRNFRLLYSSKKGKTAHFRRITDPNATVSYPFYNAVSDRDLLLASLVSCTKYHLCRNPDPESRDPVLPLSFSWSDFFVVADAEHKKHDVVETIRRQLIKSVLPLQECVDAGAMDDYADIDDLDVSLDADNDGVRPLLDVSPASSGENDDLRHFAVGVSAQQQHADEGLAAVEAEDIFDSFVMTPMKIKPKRQKLARLENTTVQRRHQISPDSVKGPAVMAAGASTTPKVVMRTSYGSSNEPYQAPAGTNHRRSGTFVPGDCAAYAELSEFVRNLATDPMNGRVSKISQSRDGGDLITFHMKGSYKYCGNVQRHHNSNNIWFIVNVDRLCWQQRCFDSNCNNYRSEWMDLPVKVARQVAARRDAKFGERTVP